MNARTEKAIKALIKSLGASISENKEDYPIRVHLTNNHKLELLWAKSGNIILNFYERDKSPELPQLPGKGDYWENKVVTFTLQSIITKRMKARKKK